MFEDLIPDYKRAIKRIEEQQTEINILKSRIKKLKEYESRYNKMAKEYNHILDTNARLVDIVKEYNPNHFGKREPTTEPYVENWW